MSTVPCNLVTQIKAIVLEKVPDDVMFHLATGGPHRSPSSVATQMLR